jgi:hypothetical protein
MLSNFSPEFVVTRCWREVLIAMLTLKLPRRSQYQSKKMGVWTPMAGLWAQLQIDFWDSTLWVGTTSSIQVSITKIWFSRLEQAGFNVKSSSKQLWAAPWRLHDQYYRPEERVLQEILLSWTTFFLATYVYTNCLRTQARRTKELFLWAGRYEQNRYMMNAVSANRGPTLQCLSTRIRSTKPSGSHLQLILHEEVAQRLGIFIWGLQGVNHNNCAQICDPSGSRLEYPSLLQNRSRDWLLRERATNSATVEFAKGDPTLKKLGEKKKDALWREDTHEHKQVVQLRNMIKQLLLQQRKNHQRMELTQSA